MVVEAWLFGWQLVQEKTAMGSAHLEEWND
jgi:hypothetical protein